MNMASYRHVMSYFLTSILAQNSNVLDTKEHIKSLKKVKPLLFGLPPVLETPPPQFFLLLLKIQIPV